MADAKKKKVGPKKPTAPFIGYGTNVAAGKAINKSVKKTVVKKIVKSGAKTGTQMFKNGKNSDNASSKYWTAMDATPGRSGKSLFLKAASASSAAEIKKWQAQGKFLTSAEKKALQKKLIQKGLKQVNKALKK